MKCVHCERVIRPSDTSYTYEYSQATAHLRCVSQPSAAETDTLLIAFQRMR